MYRYKSWLGFVFVAVCLVAAIVPAQGDVITTLWDEGIPAATPPNPLSAVSTLPTLLGPNLGADPLTQGDYQIIGHAERNDANTNNLGFDFMSFSLDNLLSISSASMVLTGTGSSVLAKVISHTSGPTITNDAVANGASVNLGGIPGDTYTLWIGNSGSNPSIISYTLIFSVVPEPTSLLLLCAGAIGLLLQRSRYA